MGKAATLQGLSREASSRGLARGLGAGSALLFGGLMVGNGVGYLYQMIMARMMGPGDYGAFVALGAVSYLLAVFLRTFQAWIVNGISAACGESNKAGLIITAALRTLIPLGVIGLGVSWLAKDWVVDFLRIGSSTPIIVLGVYVMVSLLTPVSNGTLLGLNRTAIASALFALEPVFRLLGGTALVLMGLGVSGAMGGYAVGQALTFGLGMALVLPYLWPPVKRRRAERLMTLDRYTLLLLVVNVCLMVAATVDQIAVKHFFSSEVAGNYAVAFVLGRVIVMTAVSLGWVVFTRSSTIPVESPQHRLLLFQGLAVAGAISLTLTAVLLLMPKLAVAIVGGSQYRVAGSYVGLVGIEMTLFAFVYVQAYYHISLKRMQVAWPLCAAVGVQFLLLARYHATVQQILFNLIIVMVALFLCVSFLTWRLLPIQRVAGETSIGRAALAQ